jgi:nitrile hydratase
MNGPHDMGGMHGLGPVRIEKNEPVFHARWEGRVYAMTVAIRAGKSWNIDTGRHHIELIPAAEYFRMSYYERWFARLVDLLIETGLVTREEVDRGKRVRGAAKAVPALTTERAASTAVGRGTGRSDARVEPRFHVGQRVRARNINPTGHTRLPRYARGRLGTIDRNRGVFIFPDTNAHDRGEKPQHVYSVRFAARELWGAEASPRDSVNLDMWDDYLEPA